MCSDADPGETSDNRHVVGDAQSPAL